LFQGQGIDTTTPSGKAMFGMLSVFADFERSIIRERGARRPSKGAQGRQTSRQALLPRILGHLPLALISSKIGES